MIDNPVPVQLCVFYCFDSFLADLYWQYMYANKISDKIDMKQSL